jgi:four helix bundle protein
MEVKINQSFRDLTVYKKAFNLAMQIFELSKKFPVDERYSLTDQIRRSSRPVCSCIAEAYRKRQYESYFVSKTSDSDMENSETQVWLNFSYKCKYLEMETYQDLLNKSEEIGKMLNHMIQNPEKYRRSKDKE